MRRGRRLLRTAPKRPPIHVVLAAGTEAPEIDVMKPRPASFVDNKLKQRIIQVCRLLGSASQRSLVSSPARCFSFKGKLRLASCLISSQSGFRRGSVDNFTPWRVRQTSSLYGVAKSGVRLPVTTTMSCKVSTETFLQTPTLYEALRKR